MSIDDFFLFISYKLFLKLLDIVTEPENQRLRHRNFSAKQGDSVRKNADDAVLLENFCASYSGFLVR